MALPSQSSRPSTASRSFGARPRTRSIPRPILLASIAGIGAVALGWWTLSGTTESPQPGDLQLASDVAPPKPAEQKAEVPRTEVPKPEAAKPQSAPEQPKQSAPLEIG